MQTVKHAIVTGGSSGIGKATAAELLDRGWRVSILALDDLNLHETYAALQTDASGRVHIHGVDVTDRARTRAAVEDCVAAQGPVDALITSAGVAKPARFQDLSDDDFIKQMDVNFHGTINSVSAVYSDMKARGSGNISLISSGAGLLGVLGHTAYAPTKFAVRGFGEALRMEAKPHGINVSVCYLPDTDTPQLRANAGIRPAETAAISGAGQPWCARHVGGHIVDGIERGSQCVTPGWQMTFVNRLASPIAGILRWHVDRIVARTSRRNIQI